MIIRKVLFEEIFPEYVRSYENVISIPVIDTDELNEILDKIRAKEGKVPFYNGDHIDADGFYEFRLILDRETFEPVEIEAWCENYTVEDDDCVYHVPIDNRNDVMCQVINQVSEHEMLITDLR